MAQLAPAPTVRKVRWLFLGVCLTLLILLSFSGVLAIRFLERLHEQELAAIRTLESRAEMLSGLWLSIQNYNQAVEEFIASAKRDQEPPVSPQLDRLTVEIDSDLKRYPSERDPVEAALLDVLQNVFTQQRTLYVSVLLAPPGEHSRQTLDAAPASMVPVEKQIREWSGKLRTWNAERLQHADHALVSEFESLQSGLTRVLTIGFGSGLLLVMAGMAYIVRLERQTHRRNNQLAQSQRELQQLSSRLVDAQETERRSISRELHDEVGQALGVLLVDLGRLSSTISTDRPEVRKQIDSMKSVAERTVQAVRDISLLLRPSMLDDLGLVAALEWQGREVSRHSNIEVDVQSSGVSEDLPEEYRICLYRLVQEALNNAVRHSGAKTATVKIRQSGQSIFVQVIDDGRGFDPRRTRGLGILGMEERVKSLSGSFRVESEPSRGATIIAEIPLASTNGQPS